MSAVGPPFPAAVLRPVGLPVRVVPTAVLVQHLLTTLLLVKHLLCTSVRLVSKLLSVIGRTPDVPVADLAGPIVV